MYRLLEWLSHRMFQRGKAKLDCEEWLYYSTGRILSPLQPNVLHAEVRRA